VNTDDTTEFDQEKYFENPTYDGTNMIRVNNTPGGQGVYKVPVLPVAIRQHQAASSGAATYDAVNTTTVAFPKPAGKQPTYDVLDRGKINSKI
jgi:hypothetical protein